MDPTSLSRRTMVATLGTAGSGAVATKWSLSTADDTDTHPEVSHAVVDRIIDGAFVVLILEDGDSAADQRIEPVETITDTAVAEGDVLRLVLDQTTDTIVDWQRLEEETRRRRAANKDRIDQIDDLFK